MIFGRFKKHAPVMDYQLSLHNLSVSVSNKHPKLLHAMAAAFAARLFLVLSLFYVLIDVAISRSRIDAFEAVRKPDDSSQNVSASPNMKSSPDYMLRLLQRLTNSDGDQVPAGAMQGNIVYGITENG